MEFNKWANILKVILLRIVDELERRINERNGVEASDSFSTTLYSSLRFIVLEQVDGLVDEAVGYTRKQVHDLSTLIADKTAGVLASLVYVLILLGLAALVFLFLAIALSLWLGDVLGSPFYGFLITGGITLLLVLIIYFTGHKKIAGSIRRRLVSMM